MKMNECVTSILSMENVCVKMNECVTSILSMENVCEDE